jgi:hypothetical protein
MHWRATAGSHGETADQNRTEAVVPKEKEARDVSARLLFCLFFSMKLSLLEETRVLTCSPSLTLLTTC